MSVKTTGGDLDADGYELVLGSQVKRLAPVNGILDIANVSPGTYPVALESVADNCEVSTTSVRSVTITAGQTSDVGFSVECAATGIAITTSATGANIPNSFQLVLNDQPLYEVAVNSSTVVSRLKPGSYAVGLIIPGDNCSVVGSSRVTVDVAARDVAPVLFEIACVPAVRREKIAFVTDTVIDGSTTTWIATVNPDGSGRENLAPRNAPRLVTRREQVCFLGRAMCQHVLLSRLLLGQSPADRSRDEERHEAERRNRWDRA